jgi:S1-C subfamily serine protease
VTNNSSNSVPLDTVGIADKVRPATVMVQNLAMVPRELLPILGAGEVPRGLGTGFIYDESGYIATNNHVVEGAQRVRVILPPPDNRAFDARIVGTDPSTDLAVVKVEGSGLPTVALGSSSALRVGEDVVAVGNALGLSGGPTVTTGVVSALGRDIEAGGEDPRSAGTTLYGLIQTDAAINRGNSGGPLVNRVGEVVGVNTVGALGAQTIGFAIAIDPAKPILEQLQKNGRVARGYLGISLLSASPGVAALVDSAQTQGVVVANVTPDSPAAAGGIQQGDVIVQIGDTPVKDRGDLENALATQYGPGQRVPVKVIRNGNERTVDVALGQRPSPRA